MNKLTTYGGIIASALLIVFGVGAITAGIVGREQVRDELARENIVGTPDMAGIAGEKIDTGGEARDFAAAMREHTLAATDGRTYAEMPRFATEDGTGTNDEAAALKNPETGAPVDNPARQIWVTETALTTALNTSYFAEMVALFSMVMGFALLLAGVGFGIITLRVLRKAGAAERTAGAGAAVSAAL